MAGFQIAKVDEAERMVYGWANVAALKDGQALIDLQGDVIDPLDLEKAANHFMHDWRASGVMHTGQSRGTVLESVVFTPEKMQKMGIPTGTVPLGWWVGVRFDAETFAKVKAGTLPMFSVQGSAKRVPIDA